MSADTTTGTPLERLLDLVPVHHRSRDLTPAGEPGPLTSILKAVAGELDLLEKDVQRLYDGWFVETCEEWLIPYLADLVGLQEAPPDLGVAVSRRALVANTVAYRRRKGTVAVLEQVTRDVTGWPARAVEHHPRLATSAHVNHVRLDRPAAASTRHAVMTELAAVVSPPTARATLDPFQHTAEVRRIASRRGRYGIRNVGIFPFAVQAYAVGGESSNRGAADGWSRTTASGGWRHFDPLGRAVPLFAPPRAEEASERLCAEPDLPLPLRPRRLLAMLEEARAGGDPSALPLGVRIGMTGVALPPERIRVCGLEDLADVDGPQVMVDAIGGRLRAYRRATPADPIAAYVPAAVFVRYAYGALADVGAGTYDRSDEHDRVLATDRWERPGEAEQAGADAQVAVPDGADTIAEALVPVSDVDRATFTVSISDSDLHAGGVAVAIPRGTRLVLVAATWPERELPRGERRAATPGVYAPDGVRPHVRGPIAVSGEAGSSVVIDGLALEGDLVVDSGDLGSLTVAHCTIEGELRVRGEPQAPNAGLEVRLVRSAVGRVRLSDAVPVITVADSILDAPPGNDPVLSGEAAHASLEGSTVRGAIAVRTLDASSCILDGVATAQRRQTGCVRFSYVGPGSRTPRRHRCVPLEDDEASVVPAYVSTDPASPAYLALAASCSPLIAAGGDGDAEMGVHHHIRRPLRIRAAQRQLEPYLPVGIELGIFGS
jgi:P2-related tail formation protein